MGIDCISGSIRLFGSLLYIPAIRYFSRRGLLCISSFIMGISLILLGLAVYSHHSKDSALRHVYYSVTDDEYHNLYHIPIVYVQLKPDIKSKHLIYVQSASIFTTRGC